MEENKNIKQLLQKFLNNDCSQSEVDLVVRYFQAAKQTEDFPTIEEVLELFQELPKVSEKASDKIIRNILKDSKPKYHIWRYAAAAILIIALASTYFLRDTLFNNHIENTTPKIVNNQIQPGIDKATLTLETGETVALEKGTQFQTQNATSNGEEIIYLPTGQAGNTINSSASRELVFNYLTIPRGGQFQMTLSDGTKVWLNSETQLKYPVSFTDGESRQVELVYGEAYFEVSPSTKHKGSDFKVYHSQQEVQVLGTAFNIKAYKDETHIYTTLVEGKVAVSYKSKSQMLTPNQQSNLDVLANDMVVTTVEVGSIISWKDGVFDFESMPLKDIMTVLSRWYDMDVTIENKDLEDEKFIGSFNKRLPIEEILSSIKSTNSINTYEINNKTITIY